MLCDRKQNDAEQTNDELIDTSNVIYQVPKVVNFSFELLSGFTHEKLILINSIWIRCILESFLSFIITLVNFKETPVLRNCVKTDWKPGVLRFNKVLTNTPNVMYD